MTKSISIASPEKLAADRYAGLSIEAWRWLAAAALIVLAVLLPFALSNYHVFELTMVMIYAIAVERGVRMPSFFGYMLWSGAVILPPLVLLTFAFAMKLW